MLNDNVNFYDGGVENKKKYLFLTQKKTLDQFLENGALSQAQYDFSYNGLITKMNISEKELSDWLGEGNDKE